MRRVKGFGPAGLAEFLTPLGALPRPLSETDRRGALKTPMRVQMFPGARSILTTFSRVSRGVNRLEVPTVSPRRG